jgi:hypothetical protein
VTKCHSTRKLCSSKNWTTFILVDFEVFGWNLGNAAKVPEDIHRRQGFSGVWPCLWPRVDHRGVLTWSRGSIGVVGSVFEVMTQVDLGLTNVDRFDSADSALALMSLIKNLGHHSLPPLRRILSRDSKFQGQDRETGMWSSMIFGNYPKGANTMGSSSKENNHHRFKISS